jgi:hypothetical protein
MLTSPIAFLAAGIAEVLLYALGALRRRTGTALGALRRRTRATLGALGRRAGATLGAVRRR